MVEDEVAWVDVAVEEAGVFGGAAGKDGAECVVCCVLDFEELLSDGGG